MVVSDDGFVLMMNDNGGLSRYGTEFLRNAYRHLAVEGDAPVDVQFKENGYLFLASPQGRPVLESNHRLQKELGSDIEFLPDPTAINTKFPYLHTDVRRTPHHVSS